MSERPPRGRRVCGPATAGSFSECPSPNSQQSTIKEHQLKPTPKNMTTRNGKIARLPNEIREQLNTRLADGEPGSRLVEWLNANPAVAKVMAEHFDGRPINEGNVSEWRTGGFEEWLTLRAFLDEARILSENSGQIADTGISSERLHLVLLAHHAYLLQNLGILPADEFDKRLKAVTRLTASIMKMRRAEQNEIRLQLQRERLELLREIQSLKSASTSKAAASTSGSARSNAAATRQAAPPPVSPSGPGIPSSSDSPSAQSAHSLPSTPIPSPAPNTPPLTAPIQPESPDCHLVAHSPCHPLIPSPLSADQSDSLRSTQTHPTKLAA